MSQQHACIIFKTSKIEECINKKKTCKNPEAIVPVGFGQALEHYIQFKVQKLQKDKETWSRMREKQEKRLKY